MKTVTMYLSEKGDDRLFKSQEEADKYDAVIALRDALLDAMGGERERISSTDGDKSKAWQVARRIADEDVSVATAITQVLTKERKDK